MASLDEIFTSEIGALGRWQWGLFILVTIATSPPILQFSQLATIAPPHFCPRPQLEQLGWSLPAIRNDTLTLCRALGSDGRAAEQCAACEAPIDDNASALAPCDGEWRYVEEEAPFRHSLAQEFDLVCNRKILIPFTSMAYTVGMGIGYIIGGVLGDRFGRRIACIASGLSVIVACIVTAFSQNIWMVIVFRAVSGILFSICNLNSYVYCNEVTNARHRNTYSFFFHFNKDALMNPFSVSMAYLIQDWRIYHVVLSAPSLLVVLFFFLVPDSPRWLLSIGREKAAFDILTRAAAVNGRQLQADLSVLQRLKERITDSRKKPIEVSWTMIFTDRKLRLSTATLSIIWFVAGLNYYGLWFFVIRLRGSPYIIAAVSGLLGVPMVCLKIILFHFFDRRRPFIGVLASGFLFCSVTLIGRFLWPDHISNIVLATSAMGCAVASFFMVYNVTPEQFPTVVRAEAMGFLLLISRVGSTLGLLVERFDEIIAPAVPLGVFTFGFGISACAAAFLSKGVMETGTIVCEAEDEENEEEKL